jgi:hypothetical protein
VRRVPAGEEQVEPSREVDEAVAAAQLVRAQIQAEERAARGDFDGAGQVMARLHESALVRGHAIVAEACERVGDSVRDRAMYDRSTATRASMRKGFSRSVSGMVDGEVEALLERSGRGVKSRAQRAMEDSFGVAKAGPAPEGGSRPPRPAGSRASLTRTRSRRW